MKNIGWLCLALLLSSCNRCNHAVNEASNKAGETTGNIVKNVTNGVKNAFDVKAQVADGLTSKGINTGKVQLNSNNGGTDNVLSIYIIFNKDFKAAITAKVFDAAGLEMGRTTVTVNGKAGQATFVDFSFDKRTNIDNDSKLMIE
jgi:hypothetical protein